MTAMAVVVAVSSQSPFGQIRPFTWLTRMSAFRPLRTFNPRQPCVAARGGKRTGSFGVSNADKLPSVQANQDVGSASLEANPVALQRTRELPVRSSAVSG